MVTTVLLLGLGNLALGVALALALNRLSQTCWTIPRFPRPRPVPKVSSGGTGAARRQLASHASPFGAWETRLSAEGIRTRSFAEAALWIAKLETAALRQSLLATGHRGRPDDQPTLRQRLDAWRETIRHWSDLVSLQKEAEPSPRFQHIDDLLEDQLFRLSSCQLALTDHSERCFDGFLDAVTCLRDRVDESLASWLREESRLDAVPELFRRHPETGVLSRLGLEAVMESWRSDDPEGRRAASAILLDLDRFVRFNQRLGAAGGELVLQKLGELFADLVRKGRGFDRVGQVKGPRFLLFLGDTAGPNAAKVAERVRQTVEATTFKVAAQTLEATLSCGISDLRFGESLSDLLRRLELVLVEAKKAGRNRSCLEQGQMPQLVELLPYPVVARTIEL